MEPSELQSLTLKILAQPGDKRLGRGVHYLAEAIKQNAPGVTTDQILETYWSLVGQGLAYIDMTQPAPENWELELSTAGEAAISDAGINPNDPAGYLQRLRKEVPRMSDTVRQYAEEAVHAYNHRLYFASAVMVGVASEAAFIELAESLLKTLSGQEAKNFSAVLNTQKNYIVKFTEFRKRLEGKKPSLPPDFVDGMDITMSAVQDTLRIYRNEAGHPKGKKIDRDDCFINLQMFVRYLKKMYELKNHFEQKTPAP